MQPKMRVVGKEQAGIFGNPLFIDIEMEILVFN
jgi:hypothetical protein